MYRKIKFKNFRNLGVDQPTSLTLNHSIDDNSFGDLIILIGENNSGKSNVLEGIEKIKDGVLTSRDKTTFNYEEDCIPSITLEVSDENVTASYELSGIDSKTKKSVKYEEQKNQGNVNKKSKQKEVKYTEEEIKKNLEDFINVLARHININQIINIYRSARSIDEKLDLIVEESGRLFNLQYTPSTNKIILSIFEQLKDNLVIKMIIARNPKLNIKLDSNLEKAEKYFNNNYEMSFIPKIVRYIENEIKKNSLSVVPSQITSNSFIGSIFRAIDISVDEVKGAYKQYETHQNIAFLSKLKGKIKAKIETLNKRYNELYYSQKHPYIFSIELDSNRISFGMARGKDYEPIILEYQSTGFKWFFNFYFNFLYTNDLPKGSIVIMDEPATNLHPQGQVELRKFIKDYAKKSGITFIIATHIPFLIDPYNFDELRIVSAQNSKARIDNLFSAANIDDPDSLKPVKEALTIKSNIIYDFETEVVWVEGITDYNYLTMFKDILGFKNKIAFLPFNGVGKDDETQKQILNRLVSLKFAKRSILLDGDKAGKDFKEKCKNTCFKSRCVMISDLNADNKKFKDIEDLFSSEDKAKYLSLNSDSEYNKKASYTAAMKKTLTKNDFSEETLENFRKLLKLIIE